MYNVARGEMTTSFKCVGGGCYRKVDKPHENNYFQAPKKKRELPKLSGTLQIRAYVTCIFLHSRLRWRCSSGTVGRDLYTDVRK